MYNYSTLGEILLEMSTNGSCQLTRNFPTEMNDLFNVFEFIPVYINKKIVLTKAYWTDHYHKLELTLNKPK